ncbi:ATP-binding protein [Streptosporangium subroseum]|uniref:ATP-binding protein n=1 Tax=Streptosporangium subroseum TaxID=106412 RepID=UPI003091EA50|nr:ATP-binding protein [Streptosporangium subroseum]
MTDIAPQLPTSAAPITAARHAVGKPRPELIHAMVALRPGGLIWRRTFLGHLDQVSHARRFVRLLLDDSPCGKDAELIVSELVSNALRHTSSGQAHGSFIVEVIRKVTSIRICVYDCGWGGTPKFRQKHSALSEEGGRGLMIVAALASKVGYRGTQAVGHVVWAQFDLPAQ